MTLDQGSQVIGRTATLPWVADTAVEVRVGSDCAAAAEVEPPAAPTNLRIYPKDGGLDVAWNAPPGSVVAGYEVQWKAQSAADAPATTAGDPGTGWVSSSVGNATGIEIGSLANGTAYDVRVRASNAAGDGPWATGTGTPGALAPPANLAVAPGDGKLDLSWTAPAGTLVGYNVHYTSAPKTGTGSVADDASVQTGADSAGWVAVARGEEADPPAASQTITSLSNDTPYRVRVRALSAAIHDFQYGPWAFGTGTPSVSGVTLPAVTLSVSPDPVTEGASVTVTARLSSRLSSRVEIPLTLTAGTAEAGDFGSLASIAIGAGRTSGTGTIATVQDDDTDDETFTVALDAANLPATVAAGATASVTVTIDDDDTPMVTLWASPRHPVKAGESVTIEARLSAALPRDVTIPLTLTPDRGTTSADYGTLPSIRIAAGETSGTGTLATVADADTEYESFWVGLGTLPAEVRQGVRNRVRVTIAPANIPIVWLSAPETVNEGEAVTVTAHLTEALSAAVEIPVTARLNGGSGEPHKIPIAAGETSGTLDIATPHDDNATNDVLIVEIDQGWLVAVNPQVRIVLFSRDHPTNVVISVLDRPALTAQGGSAREGQDDAVAFTVRLSYAPTGAVRVSYTTVQAAGAWQGAAPATAGADYTHVAGTVAFLPGERAKTVSVPIVDDAVDEGTEHFLLTLSEPQGAYVKTGHGEAHGLITNDDHLQSMWLARFGRTVGSQVTDAVSERLSGGLAPGAHATLAGQRVDLSKADDGKALAEVMTGLAQKFGAPGAPAATDDPGSGPPGSGPGQAGAGPFARHGPGGGWNDPALSASARSVTGRELLLGSSFNLATGGEGSGPGLAAWGRVAHGSFNGEHADDTGRTGVDGEVVTGVLGADADFGRLLAGVAVSLSEGEGRFDSPGADVGGKGGIESTMTTVSPYARFKVTGRVSAWGLAGWGTGDMTIRFDDGSMEPIRTGLSMQLGAIGARGALLTQDGTGGMDLALKTDAFFVRVESEAAANSVETGADASRVRLVLEGGRRFALGGGATLRPSLELGVRHDGGDAETGTGVEIGGGVAYADPASGLTVDARARMLAAHADADYEEWGASAAVRLDPGERGRGLSLSLVPTIGTASSATERLWGARDARGLAPGGAFEAARGLRAEAGYGMALLGDRFTGTPNVGFGMSDGGARDYRVGWRLTSAVRGDSGFEVSLDAVRREPAGGDEAPEHGVMLRGAARW